MATVAVSVSSLGSIVTRNTWASGDEIFSLAAGGDVEAMLFIRGMCQLRQSVRRPLNADVLVSQFADTANEDAVVVRVRYRQLYFCLRAFYAAYACLRGIAAPRRRLDERHQMGTLSRTCRRLLSATGLVHHRGRSVHDRANDNLAKLWDRMRGAQCVLWVDNYYKMRYGVNPCFSDHSVNATAFAVMLNVRPLGPFRGYPSLAEVYRRMPVVIQNLIRADVRLVQYVRDSFGGVSEDAIRVPLDVCRGRCQGQKWHPFLLQDTLLGSQSGLLDALEVVRKVNTRTGRVVPVLLDENGHYRIMRWMYSRSYHQFRIREELPHAVFVYGVWHAYKFLCLHLHRQFFNVFCYIDQGLLNSGDSVSCVQKLGMVERLVAALWIRGVDVLRKLDAEINRIMCYHEGVSTRSQTAARRPPATAEEEVRWLTDIFHRREPSARRQLIPSRLWFLMQLRLLITEYCPAVFVVGYRVRSCTWGAQQLGTSAYARDALQFCLNLLLRLSTPDSKPLRYTRTISAALLTWTAWTETSPGVIHAEESCEALLSKVTRGIRVKGNAYCHSQYEDVFLATGVAKTKDAHAGHVPQCVLDAVRERLDVLCDTQMVPPMVRWHCQRPLRAEARTMPARVFDEGPLPILHRLSARQYKTVLRNCLLTLMSGRQVNAEEDRVLTTTFSRRSDAESALVQTDCVMVEAQLHTSNTRRLRRRL